MTRFAVLLAGLVLMTTPALAQSSLQVSVGPRMVAIAVPAGFQDLAAVAPDWNTELMGYAGEGETALAVIVSASVSAQSSDWQSTTPYALVSVVDNSLGGTTSAADFTSQFDFLVNGLRDVSPLSQADAQALIEEAIAGGDSPPRFDAGSRLAIDSVQVLAVPEFVSDSGAITILHPTPDRALLINDIGFINLNGQMLKVAGFAVLQDAATVSGLQALGKSLRDGTLAAN